MARTTTPAPPISMFTVLPSPVGELVLTGRGDDTLAGCWFGGGSRDGLRQWDGLTRDDSAFAAAATQLREYFAGDRREFSIDLSPEGTDFQLRVWARLRAIPYGETRSYGQVAAEVGSPAASRAVGLANGRNPISIVVPCHRVIGANGSLTGYGGGIDNKRYLLGLESGVLPLG